MKSASKLPAAMLIITVVKFPMVISPYLNPSVLLVTLATSAPAATANAFLMMVFMIVSP